MNDVWPSEGEAVSTSATAASRGVVRTIRRVAVSRGLIPLMIVAVLAACAPAPPPTGGATASPPPSATTPPTSPVRPRDNPHDYNRDGYADLVIGVPEGDVDGKEAGRVEVVYGSPGGARPGDRQVIDLGSGAAKNGRFGAALASGDFDKDGYADLAIGAPGKGTAPGSVAVVFGTDRGLSDKAVILPTPSSASGFGSRLAAGDFNRDGYQDLAAGDTYSLWVTYGGRRARAGRATWRPVLTNTADLGPIASGDVTGDGYADLAVVYSEDDPADEGTGVVYRGSRAGLTSKLDGDFPGWGVGDVAIGDFDRDGHGDIVAGNSWEDAQEPTGQFYLIRGSATRLPEAVHWTMKTPGMPKAAAETYGFGSSLATGDVNGDGHADVLIGADGLPPGAAFLLYGGRGGLSAQGAQVFEPKPPGTPGEIQGFGLEVALTDLNGDGADELAVTTRAAERVTILSPGRANAETHIVPDVDGKQFGYTLG